MSTTVFNPRLKSWMEVSPDSDFSIHNIPFGVYSDHKVAHHLCSAIGNYVIDLLALNTFGFFKDLGISQEIFNNATLNDFIALGKEKTNAVRLRIQELLLEDNNALKGKHEYQQAVFKAMDKVEMLMPVKIGDYTDFYSSLDHATNLGKMIRDPQNALLPNWKHLPVGYHGRASSIRVSGHTFRRPKGQQKPADAEVPVYGPCKLLDFELETAFIIGKSTELGETVSTSAAGEYIFGMVLFNDWSARDIQTWEYQPLGPFLSKNFASTISPWIVTLEALEPFRVKGYVQEPKVLPYLEYEGDKNVDITLEVYIQPEHQVPSKICTSNYKYMYWTMEQQLAHHTVNGCNMNIGDMLASGTISGPEEHEFGSLIELSWKGTRTISLEHGGERKFLQDGDAVIIKGYCKKGNVRVGFGECKAQVLPAV